MLSGVSTAADTVRAAPGQRPDYLAPDLRSLTSGVDTLRVAPHPAWRVDVGERTVTVSSTGADPADDLSVVRATASAVWNARRDGRPFALTAADDTARRALERWSLLTPSDRLA